ncbi:hypothetical protein ACTWP6_15695 [Mycobacterium sp. 4D054]|uniref:hypothetical protein n=1 Tax=Mycobacterium sp. 4D054 TaxID=3457440 RepID=UPI003FD2D306
MRFGFHAKTASIIGAAAVATLLAAAPSAAADPAAPPPVPAPAPAPAPAPMPSPPPAEAAVVPLAAAPAAEGVPHLASPENLPPGTSTTPTQQSRLGYLRDLWHAMQTQEVSGSNALLLLTQRPLSSSAPMGMPSGPQPAAPPAAAPAPAAVPVAPAPVAP